MKGMVFHRRYPHHTRGLYYLPQVQAVHFVRLGCHWRDRARHLWQLIVTYNYPDVEIQASELVLHLRLLRQLLLGHPLLLHLESRV